VPKGSNFGTANTGAQGKPLRRHYPAELGGTIRKQ